MNGKINMSVLPSKDTECWEAVRSPGFLLWHLENLWQQEQRKTLEAFGITTVQFLLLSGLATVSGQRSISQIELALRCRAEPMMTSQVLRTLEQVNLISRSRDKKDKRAFAIRITNKGQSLYTDSLTAVRKLEEEFFRILGSDLPDFANALRVLSGERPRRRVRAISRVA